jgi:selenocysteine-specific elongation factor
MIAPLREYHQRYPLRAGMPREELKSRLGLSATAFSEAVARAVSLGALAATETAVSAADHRVAFSAAQQRSVAELMRMFQRDPSSPPSPAECEQLVGADVLAALIEQGKLVKVSDSVLFTAEGYERMTRAVVDHLQREGRITLAQVRDMFGTSRKYAQALLEHLDERRVTKRVGDERILR